MELTLDSAIRAGQASGSKANGQMLRSWLRRGAAAGVLIAAAAVGWRLWMIEGILRRVIIDGPSMAPAYLGARYVLNCEDCGFPFRVDADDPPPEGNAACPNCGYPANRLDEVHLQPAERVVIDRWPLMGRPPPRWSTVAVRTSTAADDGLVIKRVVAGPGELLGIEHGDLFLDGVLLRKTVEQWRAVRQLVHDNDYQPRKSPNLPPRWQPLAAGSSWQPAGSGFRMKQRLGGDFDWLSYQHWPCTAQARLRGVVSPVHDNDSYNQGPAPRELNVVPDVQLSCRVRAVGKGQLAVAFEDGGQRLVVIMDPKKGLAVLQGEELLFDQKLKVELAEGVVITLEAGLCDEQVFVAIDGQTVAQTSYVRSGEIAETTRPVAIGARGAGVELSQLRVWRDLYYLDPQGLPRRWQAAAPVPPQGVVVLGDNSPVSIDSRHWDSTPPAVQVLGYVYPRFWSGRGR